MRPGGWETLTYTMFMPLFQMLMAHEADIFAVDKHDRSILCCAVIHDRLEVLLTLLQDPRTKYIKSKASIWFTYNNEYFKYVIGIVWAQANKFKVKMSINKLSSNISLFYQICSKIQD